MQNVFQESLIPPGAGQQTLLDLLLLILYLIHYPYIGITIGAALCSIALCLIGRGDAEDIYTRAGTIIGEMVTFRASALVFIGILPMLTALLINRQLLYTSDIPVLGYQAAAFVLAAAGLLLLALYRRLVRVVESNFLIRIGVGSLGLFLLLNGAFGFLAGSARIIDPEKWPFIDNPIEFGLSWNAIAWFNVFLLLSICLTGAAILFFLFTWERGRTNLAESERRFLHFFGAGLTLAGAFLTPAVLLFFLVTAPEAALATGVFGAALGVIVALMLTALAAYQIILRFRPVLGTAVLLLSLVAVLGTIVTDTIARRTALTEHLQALEAMAAQIREEREAELAQLAGAKLAKSGEEIFNERCTVCHAFDVKLVGPPYLETVPLYRGDVAALKDYLSNPVKKRDDYPRMPQLGLLEAELDSVATYLMREVEARTRR